MEHDSPDFSEAVPLWQRVASQHLINGDEHEVSRRKKGQHQPSGYWMRCAGWDLFVSYWGADMTINWFDVACLVVIAGSILWRFPV